MCLVLHFRFPDGFSEISRQAGSSRLFGRKPFGESEIPWALLGKRRFLFLRWCSELWEEVFCLRAFKSEGKRHERMDVREMEHRKAMPCSKTNQRNLGIRISVQSCVTISYQYHFSNGHCKSTSMSFLYEQATTASPARRGQPICVSTN